MKKISQEIKKEVIEAHNSGMTYDEITASLGISKSTVSRICSAARSVQGKTCPKCKRGGFSTEYIFCPFCAADMRSEKERCIERLERARKLFPPPHDEKASQVVFAIVGAIEYLKRN